MIERRGIVLCPSDIHDGWFNWLRESELNVLGIHDLLVNPGDSGLYGSVDFVRSESGRAFLSKIKNFGIAVEFEIHAMSRLLPREEFQKHPEWFRMNEKGDRIQTYNLCPSNPDALDTVSSNAVKLAKIFVPTTERYYFWADDTIEARCLCPACRDFSCSDQNLIVMNAILKGLRRIRPDAMVAYLAYYSTLQAPRNVGPQDGIFLEFAPINRDFSQSLGNREVEKNAVLVKQLDELLRVFRPEDAQVLEY